MVFYSEGRLGFESASGSQTPKSPSSRGFLRLQTKPNSPGKGLHPFQLLTKDQSAPARNATPGTAGELGQSNAMTPVLSIVNQLVKTRLLPGEEPSLLQLSARSENRPRNKLARRKKHPSNSPPTPTKVNSFVNKCS